jgi:poly-gamma-glutamate synthesis protein (capsule biosynthesis protein)
MFNIIGIKTDNTSAQNTPETTQGLWTSISSPSEITQPTTTGTTSLLFLGDIMLDRGVRARIKNIGADEVFVRFTKELSANYSYTIANLEGPITTWKSRTIGEDGRGIPGFSFTFPTSSAAHIKESGIDIVSLANNHTENFGTEGLQQTFDWLTR